jgi:hypothetical protein
VASGAYSAGSLATGAGVDGWNLTEGTKADSAWTSGSGSLVAIGKAIVNAANSGVGTNGSALVANSIQMCVSDGTDCRLPLADSSGYLAMNMGKWDGTALGAPSNYGTSPGAVEVPGVNAFVTNTLTIEPGNTPNTSPWLFTINQGGNSATVNGSNQLVVDCAAGCSSTGGSSLADEGTYTQGTTSFTVAGCFYASSITNLTTGQGGAFQCTNSRKLITSSEGATGSSVSANGDFIGGGAAGGAGNLTGATVKAASTAAVSTDTSLVIDANPGGALVAAVNAGVATPGSAVVANSIQIAGSDGTNARTISTNTSGSQIVAGRTATGSALADNPVLFAGSDGTDVRNISTNSSGQQVIVGAGTAGSTSGGVLTVQGADPCSQTTKQTADFESTSSGGNFITGTSGKITYICSLRITVSTLTNISLCEATSTACSGGTPAAVYMNTGTTAANGASLGQSSTVGGGLIDNGGGTTIAKTATTGQNVDVLFTTTNTPQVNAHATYVQE